MGMCIGEIGCREMVHMAIDGMWQVFDLQGPTSKNDFCRLFAKSGVLVRLVNTLHNLNEAGRVGLQVGASSTSATTVENLANKLSGIIYFVSEAFCSPWCCLLDIHKICRRL